MEISLLLNSTWGMTGPEADLSKDMLFGRVSEPKGSKSVFCSALVADVSTDASNETIKNAFVSVHHI